MSQDQRQSVKALYFSQKQQTVYKMYLRISVEQIISTKHNTNYNNTAIISVAIETIQSSLDSASKPAKSGPQILIFRGMHKYGKSTSYLLGKKTYCTFYLIPQ